MASVLRQIRPAEQGITAEEQAQRLLAWAEHELRGEGPNPHDPPVWGENLTPEVVYIFEPKTTSPGQPVSPTLPARRLIYFEAALRAAEIEDNELVGFLRDNLRPGQSAKDTKRTREILIGGVISDFEDKGRSDTLEALYSFRLARNKMFKDLLEWLYETGNSLSGQALGDYFLNPASGRLLAVSMFTDIELAKRYYALSGLDSDLAYGLFMLRRGLLDIAIDSIRHGIELCRGCQQAIGGDILDTAVRQVAHALAHLALSDIGTRKIVVDGEPTTIQQACCAVASALEAEHPGIWPAFVAEVEAQEYEIVRDELTQEEYEEFQEEAGVSDVLFTGGEFKEFIMRFHSEVRKSIKEIISVINDIILNEGQEIPELQERLEGVKRISGEIREQLLGEDYSGLPYFHICNTAIAIIDNIFALVARDLAEDRLVANWERRVKLLRKAEYRTSTLLEITRRISLDLPIVGTTFTITRPDSAGAAAPEENRTADQL